MFLKKSKVLIYILLLLFTLNLILPIYSLAIDEDSIYVWSNSSSSVSTSSTPVDEAQSIPEDNSRKFFRNHFWQCYINGSKNWNYSV